MREKTTDTSNKTIILDGKAHILKLLLIFFLAFIFAVRVWLDWIPYVFLSKRSLCIIIFLTVIFSGILFIFIKKMLIPFMRTFPVNTLLGGILLALLTSTILIVIKALPLPDRAFLYPISEIEIQPLEEKNPASSGSHISISLFDTGVTDSFSAFDNDGSWFIKDGKIQTDSKSPLRWKGHVFHQIRLDFDTGPTEGIIQIRTPEQVKKLDLFD